MITEFSLTQLSSIIRTDFCRLNFTKKSIRFLGEKIGRTGLAQLCSFYHARLQAHPSVINGIYKVSPACSWQSLTYKDLYSLCIVILHDYSRIYQYNDCAIEQAFSAIKDVTPFKTFIDSKRYIDVNIKTIVSYEFCGDVYSSVDAVKEAVNKVFPSSKYNVSLKF